MTTDFMGPNGPDDKTPVVFERGGKVFANSRDVAAYFGKRHDHVLNAIDNLLKQKPELGSGGVPNFRETPYVDGQNGQTYRSFDMDRKGFTILTMGFTGAEALEWKIAYIDRFDAMEETLKSLPARDPMEFLNDPAAMRGILLTYTEKVLTLEGKVADLTPKADAFNRIAGTDGMTCLTNAAKDLQVRPKDFFAWMVQNRWIYRRAGGSAYVAYQDKIQAGLLTHKVTTVSRSDGSEKMVEQIQVTPKGMTKLASIFVSAAAE